MVDSVTASAPYYSYINQFQGVQNTSNPPSTSPTHITPATSTSPSNNNTSSNASALKSNNLTSEILSLLQGNNSGSVNPTLSLLGGGATSNDNLLAAQMANLYSSAANASITQTKNNATPIVPPANAPATGAALIDNLLSSLSQASVAYNHTIQQNVQNAINSYTPNSVPPLTT